MDLADRPEHVIAGQMSRLENCISSKIPNWPRSLMRLVMMGGLATMLAACQETLPLSTSGRAVRPIPSVSYTHLRAHET